MNNVINLDVNALRNVDTYTIKTKEGKTLALTGELAKNVSALDGLGKMTDKATLYKAIFITKIMNMKNDDFKEKYSVKDGETFITKYLGYSKKTIELYKNTIDMFFTTEGDIAYETLADYNLAQLQELCKFVRTDIEQNGVDLDTAINDLCMIAPTEFPFTMSSKNMRKAIDKYFATVDEPNENESTENESTGNENESTGNENESAGNENESAGNNKTPVTLEMMLSKCKAVLSRCDVILTECFEDGIYKGDINDCEAHFKETLDFIVGLLTIE